MTSHFYIYTWRRVSASHCGESAVETINESAAGRETVEIVWAKLHRASRRFDAAVPPPLIREIIAGINSICTLIWYFVRLKLRNRFETRSRGQHRTARMDHVVAHDACAARALGPNLAKSRAVFAAIEIATLRDLCL